MNYIAFDLLVDRRFTQKDGRSVDASAVLALCRRESILSMTGLIDCPIYTRIRSNDVESEECLWRTQVFHLEILFEIIIDIITGLFILAEYEDIMRETDRKTDHSAEKWMDESVWRGSKPNDRITSQRSRYHIRGAYLRLYDDLLGLRTRFWRSLSIKPSICEMKRSRLLSPLRNSEECSFGVDLEDVETVE